MGRAPCCDKNGLKKGPWTSEEDEKLVNYIKKMGQGTWRTLPKKAGLNRCGKSCRLRWNNYLKPDIKRGTITEEEELIILELHSILGNKWSKIATHLAGRTDNEIKNHWNTKMRRKLLKVGIDPQTHKPVLPDFSQILHYSQLISALNPAGNLMNNIFTNILLSQVIVDPTQLAKLQLMQKLVKSTVPSSSSSSSGGPNNNNINDLLRPPPSSAGSVLINGGTSGLGITDLFLTLLRSSDLLRGNNNSTSGTSSDVAPTPTISPSPTNASVNSLGSSTSSSSGQPENSLATTTTTTTPKTPINIDHASPTQVPLISSTTTSSAFDIFQNWEELMENEAFWKDFSV